MQRLVHHLAPEAKETPLLLLGLLREIDPRAELVYAGEGRWWLGSVTDDADARDERRKRAEEMLGRLDYVERTELASEGVKLSPRTVMLAKLNLQGFALIETYHGNDPSGDVIVNPGPDEYHTSMVEDFRWRDAEWRKDQGRAHVAERLTITSGEVDRLEREAQRREWLANDGRDQYRRFVKGRFQFGHGGMSGGSRALIDLPFGPY